MAMDLGVRKHPNGREDPTLLGVGDLHRVMSRMMKTGRMLKIANGMGVMERGLGLLPIHCLRLVVLIWTELPGERFYRQGTQLGSWLL